MNELTRVYVSETGESPFAVRIETGRHVIDGDEPESMGGGDLGPAPYQLLTAALGECTSMTVRWYARQQNWPLDHVAVEVTHEKAEVEGKAGKVDLFRKIVAVRGEGLTEEQRLKLIDVAAKCPVHRTLMGGSTILTTAAEPSLRPG